MIALKVNKQEYKEVITGYYHILVNALGEAIVIAKGKPEFENATTAGIDVRPKNQGSCKRIYLSQTIM